jgi:hypothetical protein
MAASMKMMGFWDIVLCSQVVVDRHFRGAYCLYHQGDACVYIFCHILLLPRLLVSNPHKSNLYIALQNENGVSCLTVIENERQLTLPYGGRNHKWP